MVVAKENALVTVWQNNNATYIKIPRQIHTGKAAKISSLVLPNLTFFWKWTSL
jgi:hypothetical protein